MIYDPDKECEIMVNRMKEFCEMRGITQYRLAKDMNMSTSGMSSIFRRKVVPSIYTLMQICNGLEVRLQICFWREMMKRVRRICFRWISFMPTICSPTLLRMSGSGCTVFVICLNRIRKRFRSI